MSYPSIKSLMNIPGVSKEKAIEIRELWEKKRKTRDYESVKSWIAQCHNEPSYMERLMCALNEIIGGYGVEAIDLQDTIDERYTPHFEYVCEAATQGILDAQMTTGVPVMFGVLTLNTEQQAIDRSGPGIDNKGDEAAMGAVEMALLVKKLRG